MPRPGGSLAKDAALDGPAPDGGLWTSKKVVAWLAS
jgi:hypothetical protein